MRSAFFLPLLMLVWGCAGTTDDDKTDECVCDGEFAPVCGDDGETYPNACFANCAGAIYTQGECANETDPTDVVTDETDETEPTDEPTDATCECPKNILYVCGEDDVTYDNACYAECAGVTYEDGECGAPLTDDDCICPAIFDPVCGEDGVTYGNSCEAACANVGAVDGPCEGDSAEPSDAACLCPDVWDPVCGDDGQTYSNACDAGCQGVTSFVDGECLPVITDEPCDCPQVWAPVCGDDGSTYRSVCFATCAGQDYAEGPCPGEQVDNVGEVCNPELAPGFTWMVDCNGNCANPIYLDDADKYCDDGTPFPTNFNCEYFDYDAGACDPPVTDTDGVLDTAALSDTGAPATDPPTSDTDAADTDSTDTEDPTDASDTDVADTVILWPDTDTGPFWETGLSDWAFTDVVSDSAPWLDSAWGDSDTSACPLGWVVDCQGGCTNPVYIGDGLCDDGSPFDLNCADYSFDNGDCATDAVSDTAVSTSDTAGQSIYIGFRGEGVITGDQYVGTAERFYVNLRRDTELCVVTWDMLDWASDPLNTGAAPGVNSCVACDFELVLSYSNKRETGPMGCADLGVDVDGLPNTGWTQYGFSNGGLYLDYGWPAGFTEIGEASFDPGTGTFSYAGFIDQVRY